MGISLVMMVGILARVMVMVMVKICSMGGRVGKGEYGKNALKAERARLPLN